jgi:exodeoxyribonuclease VII small subunit
MTWSSSRSIAMPEDTEGRFEAAISQLEKIVESLERGEPELAAALSKYETGVRLLTQCQGLLDRAERAVALLAGVDDQGNPITAPFDATATIERESRPISNPTTKPPRSRRAKPALDEPADIEPPF